MLEAQTRRIPELPALKEYEVGRPLMCTDVEGPLFVGDFLALAMLDKLKPTRNNISSRFGLYLYDQMYQLYKEEQLPYDRNLSPGEDRRNFTIFQEGTDTIFTLPILLSRGANQDYLNKLAQNTSAETPGASQLVAYLRENMVNVIGVTTAPQEPYRHLLEANPFLEPGMLFGSQYPIDETRKMLEENGQYNQEIAIVDQFLMDAEAIVDSHNVSDSEEILLNPEGLLLLRARIKQFIERDLGICYEFSKRRERGKCRTVLGSSIERTFIIGDRSKAAIVEYASKHIAKASVCITQGDGLNDSIMLSRTPVSIAINGPEAVKSAKIGVVTDDMGALIPVYELILSGETDIPTIVQKSQDIVGSRAVVHIGGYQTPEDLISEHKTMKRAIRGNNFTY